MNDRYVPWDISQPGISFDFANGRISVFLKTLDYLAYPEFIRFLFKPDSGMFAIQACGMNDEGAKPTRNRKPEKHFDIKTADLVRLVYSSCGWNTKIGYRVAGEVFPKEKLIIFDLNEAFEIHEGRLTRVSKL